MWKKEAAFVELKERIAYLQGLAAGFEFAGNSKEDKVLAGILEVLGEMATRLQDLESDYKDMEDYMECLDQDLADVENEIFGDELYDEDDDFEEYDLDDVCCEDIVCPHCGEHIHICDEDDEFDEQGEPVEECCKQD